MSGRGNGGPVNGNRAHGGGRFQNTRQGGHQRGPAGRGGAQGFRGGGPRQGGKKGRG
jgi:hypothetical protein